MDRVAAGPANLFAVDLRGQEIEFLATLGHGSFGYFARKVNTVVSFNGSPGRITMDGKFGWWMASG